MRRIILYLLLLLGISSPCFAQNQNESNAVNVTKITFLNPGISYEKAIRPFQSLYAHAYMSTTFAIGYSSSFGTTAGFSMDPALLLQYRYYYNNANRQAKGKRTEMNSLNYISPSFETVFTKNRISTQHYVEMNRRPINTIGVVWGLQRNYEKRFSLDLNLGVGYLFTTATVPDETWQPVKEQFTKFTTLGGITLGFWLNKRK